MAKIDDFVDYSNSTANIELSVNDIVQQDGTPIATTLPPTKKRGPGRPSKNTVNTYTDIVTVDDQNAKKQKDSFEFYLEKKYGPNANLLYQTIDQSNNLYNNIEEEINKLKEKPSYGGKQKSMTMSALYGTQVGVIGTKISAVRELNNIRNKISDLVLKKEQMMKDTGEVNSDKMVVDAYNALINSVKYGLPTINSPLAQSSINTGFNLSGNMIPTNQISSGEIVTPNGPETPLLPGNTFTNNPNPIQNRMILEHNPNIKTVVVYDQSSGHKYFETVNVNTGQRVDNVQTPAQFLLDDMRIDPVNGIAVNSNANMSFPLVLIGNRAVDEL